MTIRWWSAPSLLLHTALISGSVSCGTDARVHAQTGEPRFEVASVKKNTSDTTRAFWKGLNSNIGFS